MKLEQVRAFRRELETALAVLATRHGIDSFEVGSMTYSPNTIKFRVVGTPRGALPSAERELDAQRSVMPGLPASGEEFEWRGKMYRAKSMTSRGSLIASRVKDGKEFRFSPRHVSSIFAKGSSKMNQEQIRQGFMRLASELSPENLTCDGELSSSEVRLKQERIKTEWAALERRYGSPVNESDVWGWK